MASNAEKMTFLDFMNKHSLAHMELLVREVCDAIDVGLIDVKDPTFEDEIESFTYAAFLVGVDADTIDQLAARSAKGRAAIKRSAH